MRSAPLFLTPVLVFSLAGCSSGDKKDAKPTGGCGCGAAPKPANQAATCSCAEVAAKKAGWCEHCQKGFAEGKPVTCEKCAKTNKLCPKCTDGSGAPCVCEDCKKG